MKALLVLVLVILAAATALAYVPADVAAMVAAGRPDWATEPATLLASGSALLAAAGALRRLT